MAHKITDSNATFLLGFFSLRHRDPQLKEAILNKKKLTLIDVPSVAKTFCIAVLQIGHPPQSSY